MEEIAVDLMSIQICAQIVNALKIRIQKIVLKMIIKSLYIAKVKSYQEFIGNQNDHQNFGPSFLFFKC